MAEDTDKVTAEEPLMALRPRSDFERLLWANSEIKELKAQLSAKDVTIGELKSEIDELNYTIDNSKVLTQAKRTRKIEQALLKLIKDYKSEKAKNKTLFEQNIYLKHKNNQAENQEVK